MTPPGAERGLQRERTALAWDRTGVSFLISSALLVRVVGPPYASPRQIPGALGLLLGLALMSGVAGRRGGGPHRAGEEEGIAVRPAAVRLTAAAAVALSLACLVAVAGG